MGGGDGVGPGPGFRDSEDPAAGAADDPSGHREHAKPEAFGFGQARPAGERQALQPGHQVAGEGADFQPYLVLRGVVERQVPQAGVLGGADTVLDTGVPGGAAAPARRVARRRCW